MSIDALRRRLWLPLLVWTVSWPASAHEQRRVAACLLDIDRTQTTDRAGAKRLALVLSARSDLYRVPVTGRSIKVGHRLLTEAGYDVAACYSGAIVRGGVEVRGKDGQLLPAWRKRMQSLGWGKDAVNERLWAESIVINGKAGGKTLITPTPAESQGPYRTGILIPKQVSTRRGKSTSRLILEELVVPLSKHMVVLHEVQMGRYERFGKPGRGRQVATVISDSMSVPGAVYVELVPVVSGQPVDKLAAMRWSLERQGIPVDGAVFAGDGTNDPLVRAARAGFKVVVVGNAEPAFKQALREAKAPNMYFAKGAAAFGVLEGLRHFGLTE